MAGGQLTSDAKALDEAGSRSHSTKIIPSSVCLRRAPIAVVTQERIITGNVGLMWVFRFRLAIKKKKKSILRHFNVT